MKATKQQTLVMATKVAAEHASKRGELKAKLSKPEANRVMQAIGLSVGFVRVPYGFAVGELREVWAKEYTASLKRKQPVTAKVKASVAKPKTRTRRAAKPQTAKVEVEVTTPTEPNADDDRVASLEAKLDKLAELVAALVTK